MSSQLKALMWMLVIFLLLGMGYYAYQKGFSKVFTTGNTKNEKFIGVWQLVETKDSQLNDIITLAKQEIYTLEKLPNTSEGYIFGFGFKIDMKAEDLFHSPTLYKKKNENVLYSDKAIISPIINMSSELIYDNKTDNLKLIFIVNEKKTLFFEFTKVK